MVSHYRILQRIGEGGMGIVYKAEDLRLERLVALKFLPPDLANDPAAVERFRREAKAASALNHSNICTIYDVGEQDGQTFIAMEFLDGSTLNHVIARVALDIETLIPLAIQITNGLDAAHSQGIVHRDIKPANIFITKRGDAKILDFGLAKLTLSELGSVSLGSRNTIAAGNENLTSPGTTIGTVGYMSPEQALGKALDRRTDLFSLGAVLYEMATGSPPFEGGTSAAIFDRILNRTPLIPSRLNARLPAELNRIILKALERDPEVRYQTAADLRADLKRLKRDSDPEPIISDVHPARSKTQLAWWKYGLAALALLGLVGGSIWLSYFRTPRMSSSAEWLPVTNFTDSATQPALSPDGRMLAFMRGASTFATFGQIYVKLLPDGEPVQLTRDGTQKMSPVFSPDGSQIAYSTAFPWDTWIVPALGGEPRRLLANASGLRWIDQRHILFSEIKSGVHMALVTAQESRSGQRDIYVPPQERGMAHRSAISPDRKWVLLAEMDNSGWLPCRLVPFDGSGRGRPVGPPTGICTEAEWSPDGKWMYFNSDATGSFHIWRQRFNGGPPEQITSGPQQEEGLAIAPDGRSLITSLGDVQREIWLHEANQDRRISSQGLADNPILSGDGKRLFYVRQKGQNYGRLGFLMGELWVADLSTGGTEPLLPGIVVSGFDVSSDGRRLVYSVDTPDKNSEIWLASVDGRFPPRRLSATGDLFPRFGATDDIYFMAAEGKVNYLYRMRGDGTGRQRLYVQPILALLAVSHDGKWACIWRTVSDENSPSGFLLYPIGGGEAINLCNRCGAAWSPNAKYLCVYPRLMAEDTGTSFLIPFEHGPPASFKFSGDLKTSLKGVPGVRVIAHSTVLPGPDPSTYAFVKSAVHRNLYRIPLP